MNPPIYLEGAACCVACRAELDIGFGPGGFPLEWRQDGVGPQHTYLVCSLRAENRRLREALAEQRALRDSAQELARVTRDRDYRKSAHERHWAHIVSDLSALLCENRHDYAGLYRAMVSYVDELAHRNPVTPPDLGRPPPEAPPAK